MSDSSDSAIWQVPKASFVLTSPRPVPDFMDANARKSPLETSNKPQLHDLSQEVYYQLVLWIQEVLPAEKRENAILQLSKRRNLVELIAPLIWFSFGTISAIVQEITDVYPFINPPTLTHHQSNRVGNALGILAAIACNKETRSPLLNSDVPLLLYPFLQTTSKAKEFEYLRLCSLGVLGSLAKSDDQTVVNYLLSTEVIPSLLRIMETGTEFSRTVSTFVFQKILLNEVGLTYVCQTYERFCHVGMILGKMVISLAKEPHIRLLKHVLRCYLCLTDNQRAREALRQCLPDQLKDETFQVCYNSDSSLKYWHTQLMHILQPNDSTSSTKTPPSSPAQE